MNYNLAMNSMYLCVQNPTLILVMFVMFFDLEYYSLSFLLIK